MITLNGVTYSGNSLIVSGNKIFIDGKDLTPDSKTIKIDVNGNVDNLEVDYCESLSIKGDVGSCETTNGNVNISGNVNGNVETTNGNVRCGNISGSVKTRNGNIHHV